MTTRNKQATNQGGLTGEPLEDAVRGVMALYPDNVIFEGPVHKAVAFALGARGRGRRYAIDPADYPMRRASAVRKLGANATQADIADELGVDEKTIRNYDDRIKRLGR